LNNTLFLSDNFHFLTFIIILINEGLSLLSERGNHHYKLDLEFDETY
jgi:hypothetical protein